MHYFQGSREHRPPPPPGGGLLSTTSDPDTTWESNKNTRKHHIQERKEAGRPQGCNEQTSHLDSHLKSNSLVLLKYFRDVYIVREHL